eukprot:TRINITY_DN12992_c0_g1_i2.p1 TRINITY_DN12992_c0_g1~~TRINITY_DN12992_c0_g1_i2.p1  ORF type:complete len:235 (+),score=20.25 TRINITY_DN12992_c0_g1_i2:289-993(+)
MVVLGRQWFGRGSREGKDVAEMWVSLWFAKGELQKQVDSRLSEQYLSHLCVLGLPEAPLTGPAPTRLDYGGVGVDVESYDALLRRHERILTHIPVRRREAARLGLMVLCDQITRNVRRGTPAAYGSDPAAVYHALQRWRVLSSAAADVRHKDMAFCAASLALVFIHSEDPQVFTLAKPWIEVAVAAAPALSGALRGIHTNHATRMSTVGRVPERNSVLGRDSSVEEQSLLDALY